MTRPAKKAGQGAMLMRGADHCADATAQDRSRSGLDFVQQLLAASESEAQPLPIVLQGLAAAFGAAGAGVAGIVADAPTVQERVRVDGQAPSECRLPWLDQSELLNQVSQSLSAHPVRTAEGESWLLTGMGGPNEPGWLLWLEAPTERVWSHAEGAALALAGQALVRWLLSRGDQFPHWLGQWERLSRPRRLEAAMPVVRRLAHDFGNVLTGILGFTELALSQLAPNAASRRYLEEGYRATQQGVQLIDQLRLFSRRNAATSASASVIAVVRKEQLRLVEAWGASPHLEVALPVELPGVALDPELLRQALGQLLDNAREAIVGEGRITVSARATQLSATDCLELYGNPSPGPCVEVTVADTGCGLSAEARQFLFAEPLFSTKPRHRGLGLAMVYGIIHAHRGGIRVNTTPGQGTAIHLFLPPAAVPTASPKVAVRAGAAAGPKVLVVDDDPHVLHYVQTTLEQAGYRVQAATSAADALASYQAAEAEPFGLVLSDVVMPQTTGVDLARRLLGQDAHANVIFMSGQVPPGSLQDYFKGRQVDLLQKPFRPERLLGVVRAALARGARTGQL